MAEDPVVALLLLAAQQRGAFTWADARELGWTSSAADIARRAGLWNRLYRGVYVHQSDWDRFDAKHRHHCLAQARLLALGRGWCAARRSSALIQGLPLLGLAMPQRPQLVSAPKTASLRANNRHERYAALPAADTAMCGGTRVTAPARTVVDLAGTETFRSAVVVADAVLRAGTTREELAAVAARCASWPRGLSAQRVLAFADGLAESPLESISRVAAHELDLPAPELQIEVWVGLERIVRADFLWRSFNTIGLADGAVKYNSREDVMAEKWQIERLEDFGFEVVRWGWDHAYRPAGVLDVKLRRGFLRGGRQQLDPRVRLVATTVEANLASNLRLERRRAG